MDFDDTNLFVHEVEGHNAKHHYRKSVGELEIGPSDARTSSISFSPLNSESSIQSNEFSGTFQKPPKCCYLELESEGMKPSLLIERMTEDESDNQEVNATLLLADTENTCYSFSVGLPKLQSIPWNNDDIKQVCVDVEYDNLTYQLNAQALPMNVYRPLDGNNKSIGFGVRKIPDNDLFTVTSLPSAEL